MSVESLGETRETTGGLTLVLASAGPVATSESLFAGFAASRPSVNIAHSISAPIFSQSANV
jgi:hypothetical protein